MKILAGEQVRVTSIHVIGIVAVTGPGKAAEMGGCAISRPSHFHARHPPRDWSDSLTAV